MGRHRYNRHHVPPQHPAKVTPQIIWVQVDHHNAYNKLFGNAASLEQCIEILKRNWWPDKRINSAVPSPVTTPFVMKGEKIAKYN